MNDTVTKIDAVDTQRVARCAQELRLIAEQRGPGIAASAPAVIEAAARLLANDSGAPVSVSAARGSACGLSAEMVRDGVVNLAASLTHADLELLRSRLLQAAGQVSVQSPRVVFHVLAGNLFVSGIESMVHASLLGACSLVRCSSADTVFPRLWRDALAAVDSEFAESVAVCEWPAHEEAVTRCAIEGADCVVAFGDDTSVAAVRALTPPFKRFVGHGFKLSIAILGQDALAGSRLEKVAADLAYDFSVYDQQGCLSPRVAFLEEGGEASPQDFALALCEAMRRLAERLPRHVLDLNERAALASARDDILIRAATGDTCGVFSGVEDQFLVTVDSLQEFRLGSLNRHCDLRTFGHGCEIGETLSSVLGHISTVGIAGDWRRWREVCHELRASRVCPIGRMQRPPLGWIHDGNLPLMGLLDFCGYEFGE